MIVRSPILHKVLALMMLLAVGGLRLVPSASAAESVADPIVYTLGQTHDDTPTWQDLGLEDLLVSANGSSAEVSQSSTGSHTGQEWHAVCNTLPHRHSFCKALPTRANDYYVYFLYRLRL